MNKSASYSRIYLLTVWKESAGLARERQTLPQSPNTGWRFFLEDPHTGHRRGFANAVDLLAALLVDFESQQPPGNKTDAPSCLGKEVC